MVVEFDKSFLKSISKIKNTKLFAKIEKIIIAFESAESLNEIPNLKKLLGYSSYFRVQSGNYRIGFELINNQTVRFILVADRKDIYKKFP